MQGLGLAFSSHTPKEANAVKVLPAILPALALPCAVYALLTGFKGLVSSPGDGNVTEALDLPTATDFGALRPERVET